MAAAAVKVWIVALLVLMPLFGCPRRVVVEPERIPSMRSADWTVTSEPAKKQEEPASSGHTSSGDKTITTAPASEDLLYIKLTNLKKLLDSGVITKEEFDEQKKKILGE